MAESDCLRQRATNGNVREKTSVQTPALNNGSFNFAKHLSSPEEIERLQIFEPDPNGRPGCDHTREDVPQYLRRSFILKHYRAHLRLSTCFWSLFTLHNELFDCWSHGLTALYFWVMAFYAPAHLVTHFQFPIMLFCFAHGEFALVGFRKEHFVGCPYVVHWLGTSPLHQRANL